MPQPKKDPSVRARANRASTAATLVDDGGRGQAPPLPTNREWDPMTVAWWIDLWASPMSNEYHESDQHALFMLAALMDDFWTTDTPGRRKALSEEIRLSRQAFGLTPYDRRRLEWTIESAEESKDRGRQRRSRQGAAQPKTGDDPRSVLHAV
jgi:hypothetical protein